MTDASAPSVLGPLARLSDDDIIQSPWHREGRFAGTVELSIVVPERMEHRVRK